MSNLETLTSAAHNTSAWHLALDKIPFRSRDGLPVLSEPDNRGRLQSIKAKHLEEIVKLTEQPETKDLWSQAIASRKSLLNTLQAQHGQSFATVTLVNSSRLLLHLGRASVLENVGLYCDHTTGLPLIPGTAVKGALSTWTCWGDHFDEGGESFRSFTEESIQRSRFSSAEFSLAARIFGDNSSQGSKRAGEITFLGGFPSTAPKLGLDIVNPHVDAKGSDIDPKPNLFLSIEPDTEWTFPFLARSGQDDSKALLEKTILWTQEALSQVGLGAKTAAGYGRFRERDDPKSRAVQHPERDREAAPEAPTSPSDEVIAKWKSLRDTGNLRVALPELAKLTDDQELKKAFDALVPAEKSRRLRKNDPYWQSFASRDEGRIILKRLGLTLT